MAPTRSSISRGLTLDCLSALTSDTTHPIRRFDGSNRTSANWDRLRKDDELWDEEYDCHVHLHGRGTSQRGPSLKIPLAALERAKSPYLLDKCLHRFLDPSSPTVSEDSNSDSGYAGSITGEWTEKYAQLYIPAPSGLTKDEAFGYHISTRNYFAYILSKPVVGHTLGTALTELWQRVRQWQPTTSRTEFMKYCQEQGYSNFAEDPNYALAILYFTERTRINHTWTDAFVHCVGMHEMLENSTEYGNLSNTTKALLTRASLEMDLHIDRVTTALRWFLEEELGPEYLGLSKDARHHLDRFRSFLHSHYVERAGYFPPSETAPWDKRLWFGMYNDFHSLFEHLADKQSTVDWTSNRAVDGGVCVTQNIQAFDERHGYTPLPHPLPLLPGSPARKRTVDAQKALRGLRLGRSDETSEPKWSAASALAQATNCNDYAVMSNLLVQDYVRFERTKIGEKVNIAEARKIRWLLIYGVLQMLISITRAPKEVTDTETPTYPLCVLLTGCPPWVKEGPSGESDHIAPKRCSAEMAAVQLAMEADRVSIRPDCEADNAEDFFSKASLSRSGSNMSLNMMATPLRVGTQLSRTTSLRSSVTSLQRSMVGSLSRRNSKRRNSILLQPRKEPSFCEVVVEGCDKGADSSGDISPNDNAQDLGLDDSQLHMFEESPQETIRESALDDSQLHVFQEPEISAPVLDSQIGEPVLDYGQLHLAVHSSSDDVSPDNQHSAHSSYNGNSGRSSYLDECISPASELSCWLEPEQDVKVDPSLSAFHFDFSKGKTELSTPGRREMPPHHRPYRPNNVNAGCYTPTGAMTPQRADGKGRVWSSDSICSMASMSSSVYGDGSQQAAEIEEEELRGRRRSRALDRLPLFRSIGGRQVSLPEAVEEGA